MSGFGFLEEVSTDDQTEQPTNDMVFIFIIEKLYSVYKLYLKKIRNPLNFNTIYKQNYTGVDLPKTQFVSSYMIFIGHAYAHQTQTVIPNPPREEEVHVKTKKGVVSEGETTPDTRLPKLRVGGQRQ